MKNKVVKIELTLVKSPDQRKICEGCCFDFGGACTEPVGINCYDTPEGFIAGHYWSMEVISNDNKA